ncbi:hypothetical protein MCHI_000106 [Candidatus Magnetoovum chiemensis]|nr:hypothetical protein MCHI_000106 [Candidatus Magnetoovum chiemensis]
MEKMEKNTLLSEEGIKEKHTIELFALEEKPYPISDTFDIPSNYNIDSLVIIPVNTNTLYIYWEITDRLLEQISKELNHTYNSFVIKAFDLTNNEAKEIHSASTNYRIGKIFINYPCAYNPIAAVLGAEINAEFYDFLVSKTISFPKYRMKDIKDELWMRKTRQTPQYHQEPVIEELIPQEIEDITVTETTKIEPPQEDKNELLFEETEIFEIDQLTPQQTNSETILHGITQEMGLPLTKKEENTHQEQEKDKGEDKQIAEDSRSSGSIFLKR